ncbi:MAG: DUF1028 domain-containing protein [Alphaproteobacteria bacterium]|nr:DUF1028 domain-containing protein [Alphaproteobacteria bacterium]
MTFSIVARCAETGQFGMAVSSSSPAVAARCAHARAGVGAVSSQNVTDPRLGPQTLDAMARGQSAQDAVASVIAEARYTDYRQVLAVDKSGNTAIHSGAKTLGIHAEATSLNAAAAGNLLANTDIPQAMIDRFHATSGHLGDRLIAAMRAALEAGGEEGPVHSAGLLMVEAQSWPLAEIRCDWTESCPIEAIAEGWAVYQPQMNDYVTRALNPAAAPSYGVPGDE